jgi:large subunit ribosomal protein L1
MATKPQPKKSPAETAEKKSESKSAVPPVEETAVKEPPKIAKAGSRSRKAVEAATKESDRKAKALQREESKATSSAPQPNSRKRHSKAYLEALKLIDRSHYYDLPDAIELAKKTIRVKFDASLEMHFNLGVDPQQADQMVRASVVLPSGTGKVLRVAVLTAASNHPAVKAAGADLVGDDDLIAKIEKGQLDFDRLIATPDCMSKLGKLAKVLGPRGLMPNPKSGTVTTDPAKAVKEAKAGKVEFRIDKQGIVHQAIGKASFSADNLLDNAKALIDAIHKAKPAAAKGTYLKSITLATTMGPGIKIDTAKALAAISRTNK